MSTTIRVEFDRLRAKKNGEVPLYLCVTKDRKRNRISLGISVSPEHWDIEKECPRKNCPNKESIEKIITDKKAEFQNQLIGYKVFGKDFTAKTLVDSLGNPNKPTTVQTLFDEKIELLKSANSFKSADNYKYTMNILKEFNKHLNIPFSDIDWGWLNRFEYFLKGKELGGNTIFNHLKNLRAIYNMAIKKKCAKRNDYPFGEYSVSRLSEETEKRALSEIEINKLIAYRDTCKKTNSVNLKRKPREKKDWTQLALDVFVFSYFAGGMSFTDIARLTKDNITDERRTAADSLTFSFDDIHLEDRNIDGNTITKRRKKTNKFVKIPLIHEALEIINEYANNNDDTPYLFPILGASHKTELQKKNRIHKMNGLINKSLEAVQTKLNIQINLTTYVARHTQASVLFNSIGMSIEDVQKIMGHDDVKTTKIYIKSLDNDKHLREGMKKLRNRNLDSVL